MNDQQLNLRLLFYIEQDYSFDILRPLQSEAIAHGHSVRWLLVGNASTKLLNTDEQQCLDVNDAIAYNPDAVFAPGDRIPGFIPGLKVQVFHGLNEDKRGSIYPERGLFDLYCTEGPSRTAMLAPLADQRTYFRVAETGWLKLDKLLDVPSEEKLFDRPQILYASTFTPKLSSAVALLPEIERLSKLDTWQWLITLHPKMASETVDAYRGIENENLSFFHSGDAIKLLHRADVMLSDNSSILQEFLLLQKPVVTYRNRDPQPCMINITEPEELGEAIQKALNPDPLLRDAIKAYGPSITPFLDGQSAPRVMAATENMLREGWQDRKPRNFWRNLKMRKQLNYFRP